MGNNSPLSCPFISLILLSLCTFVVSDECLHSENSLLLQLKNNIGFSTTFSTKLMSWNKSFDCCSWDGVTCEGGRVTHLDLSEEDIGGRLDNSSALFNLQHLKSLDLSHNQFNCTIPSRIGGLSNLSHLNLADAGFRGEIPIEISHLRSLVSLDLSSSLDHLEIPNLRELVQNLLNLEELYLYGTNISTPGNRWCQALSSSVPNLRILSLIDSRVPGPLDQSLVELQSLSVLYLEGTKISSPVPKSFVKFSSLTLLNLRDCELQGTFPSEILQVPTLQSVDISYNEFLQGTLPEFQINNSLQELRLYSTKFAGRLPASLGNLWNLSTLDLSMCQFNGVLPRSMSNLTQLVNVDLSSNNFTGQVPSFNLSTKLTTLNLSNNTFGGEIPLYLFAHPSLESISLSDNQYGGPIPEFETKSYSSLGSLDLSHNNLEGLIPTSLFKLGNLTFLDLSYNKFNGTKHQQIFRGYHRLQGLDLSYNNLKSIPDLRNVLSELSSLSISNNQIVGEIPKWIWEIGNGLLLQLNLSSNYLVGMQEPFQFSIGLMYLDLHSNQLQGNIPALPPQLSFLDLSSNNFTSFPYNSFSDSSVLLFFSLSNNSLAGSIPEHICAFKNLSTLDLSLNNLSGRIPTCLLKTSNSRVILNLAKNNFKGPIPDVCPHGCTLRALYLGGNFIEGEIPKSLANCLELEFLDLGHNKLIGEFPCMLKTISTLQVLVLRSNNLYGSIECPNANGSWPMIQIFDLAHNNFNGELPRRWMTKLQRMMADEDNAHSEVLQLGDPNGNPAFRYTYTVTVTSKGLEVKLQKILTIFTSIDLSRNNFHGEIPAELGQLKALYTLNLSYNALAGQIPYSIENLRNLESLDLSRNNLSGRIPTQLQSLNFLQFLNLSFNQLVGMIPKGTQIQTFTEDSFIGNKGLCGFPLENNCSDKVPAGTLSPNPTKDNRSNYRKRIDWGLLNKEIGLFTGFGIVVMPLVLSRRWRIWYYDRVDDIILRIFPLAVARKWFLWTSI